MRARYTWSRMVLVTGYAASLLLMAGCNVFDRGGGGGDGDEGCAADADCPAEHVCDGGECVVAPPECTVDADCPAEHMCDGGTCVPAPPECTVDADCPPGQRCAHGPFGPVCRY